MQRLQTGRVMMLGISRWSEKGGSYRTVQRFFKEGHNWSKWRWLLIKQHLEARFEKKVFILVADEVVDTKSEKHTYGLGNFFHLFKAIRGLYFINLSYSPFNITFCIKPLNF
ncbi:MAG: transposase [Methylococcales bacterium]|nr:transposase [Methylococcales bacterium]